MISVCSYDLFITIHLPETGTRQLTHAGALGNHISVLHHKASMKLRHTRISAFYLQNFPSYISYADAADVKASMFEQTNVERQSYVLEILPGFSLGFFNTCV